MCVQAEDGIRDIGVTEFRRVLFRSFGVVSRVLLKPLPFPNPERLVVVEGTAPGSDLPELFGVGMEFYVHYKERSKLLDGIFMFSSGTSTFRTENRVERIRMAWPSNDMYATLEIGRASCRERV